MHNTMQSIGESKRCFNSDHTHVHSCSYMVAAFPKSECEEEYKASAQAVVRVGLRMITIASQFSLATEGDGEECNRSNKSPTKNGHEGSQDSRAASKTYLSLRVGVHSGPVVAGVIGCTKFCYDLWGTFQLLFTNIFL